MPLLLAQSNPTSGLLPALVTAASMALACAVLSVFVVSRRWAFIGEGIAHSGFGGAGTVWLLSLAFPALAEHGEWAPYAGVVVFCVLTALGIGFFTRSGQVNSDAVIGIFLVASLAWGILAQSIFRYVRLGQEPPGWDTFLFGRMDVSASFAIGAAMLCAAVVAVVVLLGKEILSYCLDPTTAQASGVPVGFIHYLLMVLVALTIVIGVRLAGNVLVTALLVLPGATALILCKSLVPAILASLVIALAGTLGGIAIHFHWMFLPTGPAIVLLLFGQFLLAYGWGKIAEAPLGSKRAR
ncbi:MAG TPA: metal ABC transporter permease [Tepidisphaeraceae bacterium]|nr:metal ABC transporter permease [Tepidisphaeraceae bacterium]